MKDKFTGDHHRLSSRARHRCQMQIPSSFSNNCLILNLMRVFVITPSDFVLDSIGSSSRRESYIEMFSRFCICVVCGLRLIGTVNSSEGFWNR